VKFLLNHSANRSNSALHIIRSSNEPFLYLSMHIAQSDNFQVSCNMKEYQDSIMPINIDYKVLGAEFWNEKYQHDLKSLAGKVNWLGHMVSPAATFVSSYTQQRIPEQHTSVIKDVNGALKEMKRSAAEFAYTPGQRKMMLSEWKVFAFSDAGYPVGKQTAYPQLGLCYGIMNDEQMFILGWESRKCKRIAYSVSHAEIFAVLQAFSCCQWLQSFVNEVESVILGIRLFVDSRVVWDLVNSSNLSFEKYMLPYVQSLRHVRATGELEDIVWIKGSANLADPLTKRGSISTMALLEQVLKRNEYELKTVQ
jgi:hypothetical protein